MIVHSSNLLLIFLFLQINPRKAPLAKMEDLEMDSSVATVMSIDM